MQPTSQPSRQPTGQPTSKPTMQPTGQPSVQPSMQPTGQPSMQPSGQPTSQPTQPTSQPTAQPSSQPSSQPTMQPSGQPTIQPSMQPSFQPSMQPSAQPSVQPSQQPTTQPTSQPTAQPSGQPSQQPSSQPTTQPSAQPTIQPSTQPSSQPSMQPTSQPSAQPSGQPTSRPTSSAPSSVPSGAPSKFPTTSSPTVDGETNPPTDYPTSGPTYDLDYITDPIYAQHQTQVSAFTRVEHSFTFDSFYYKGVTAQGHCNDWSSFTDNTLRLPFTDVYFSAISVAVDYQGLSGDRYGGAATAVCAQRETVQTIVDKLQTGKTYDTLCGGFTWRVFECNGESVLCVNCKLTCVRTEACPGEAYVVNPCEPLCAAHAYASTIVSVEFSLLRRYPLLQLPLNVTDITRTSIMFTSVLSSAGTLECAALPYNTTVSSVLDISAAVRGATTGELLYANNPAAAPMAVTVLISDLSPDTDYDIYCYTADFQRHVMRTNDVQQTRTVVRTACCRGVQFTSTHSSISQYVVGNPRAESAFGVSLDSRPSLAAGQVLLSFSLAQLSCTEGAVLVAEVEDGVEFSPPRLSFFENSTELTGSFYVRVSGTGCFRLTASAASASGAEEYLPANTTFTVTGFRASPPVPRLSNVRFSGDGSKVLFVFDASTNRANDLLNSPSAAFDCNLLVSFPGSDTASCSWTSTRQIEARCRTVSDGATVLPELGDTVTVRDGVIKAECLANTLCGTYLYVAGAAGRITGPEQPLRPVVSLVTARTVPFCADIVMDPSSSSGAGGRPWRSVQWSVTDSLAGADSIAAYLNDTFSDPLQLGLALITIPNALLFTSSSIQRSVYTISLALENFMGVSSVATIKVQVQRLDEVTVPDVRVSGADPLMYRWQALDLFASASFPACASNATNQGVNARLRYQWNVYEELTYVPYLQSASANPRYFRLEPYSLEAGVVYTVVVKVFPEEDESVAGYGSISFQVGQSGVRAVVAGASTRIVYDSVDVRLDASASNSIDYPLDTDQLTFRWSCSIVLPVLGNPCPGFSALATVDLPLLDIEAGVLVAQQRYTVSVQVSDSSGQSSTASVTLSAVGEPVPKVEVASTRTATYNPQRKVLLPATVLAIDEDATASWTSDSFGAGGLEAANVTRTRLSRTLVRGSLTSYELSVAAGGLNPGQTYSFTLRAQYLTISRQAALATVQVVMNSPPSAGVVTVLPFDGQALSTVYDIATARWNAGSGSLPLSYVLGYYLLYPKNLLVVKPVDRTPRVRSKLGQGAASLGYVVTVVARAIDIVGSTANVTTSVRVGPTSGLVDAVATSTVALAQALANADPTELSQAMGSSLSTINSADCSTVPAAYCSSLNRAVCVDVEGTCGECLDGFVGPTGSSNIPCRDPASLVPIGGVCASDTSCISGTCSWQGLCSDAKKACPNSCSGAGECVFLDQQGTQLDDCRLSDRTCSAECACRDRRYGASCALSQFEYGQVVAVREALCRSLYLSLTLQDLSADVVQSRAVSVADVLLDLRTVSDAALGNCTMALVETVLAAADLACVDTSFELITASLSAVLGRGAALPAELTEAVTEALTALAQACQEDTAPGEPPVTISRPNLQLTVALFDSSNNQSVVGAAQSAFDTFNGQPASSCAFDTEELDDTQSLGVTLFEYTSNPHGSSNSSHLGIQEDIAEIVGGDDGASSGGGRRTRSRMRRRGRIVLQGGGTLWTQPDNVLLKLTMQAEAPMPPWRRTGESRSSQEGPGSGAGTTTTAAASEAEAAAEATDVFRSLATGATLVLHNVQPINYIDVPESTKTVRCFEWRSHEYEVLVNCPSGAVLNVTCPAHKKGDFEITCPARLSQPECSTWTGQEYAVNPDCVVVDYTAYNTTCFCSAATDAASASAASASRRLQEGGANAALEFATRFAVIGADVGTTFIAAPSLTDVRNNLVILTALSVVVTVYLLGLLLFRLWDWRDRTRERIKQLNDGFHFGRKKARTIYGFYNSMFPDELRAAKWYVLYWCQLQAEHPWVAVLAPYNNIREARATKWSIAVGRLLVFLFVNCIVATVMFPDDGYCERFDSESSCEAAQTTGGFFRACEWVQANESCRFLEPDITFVTTVVLALIVALLSIPLDQLLDFLLLNVVSYFRFRRLAQQTDPGEAVPPLKAKRDEFAQAPTMRSLMLQAARLEKIRKTMDFVLPGEEALLVALEAEKHSTRRTATRVQMLNLSKDSVYLHRHYVEHASSVKVAHKQLARVRSEAGVLSQELEQMPTQEERELFLMRHFIVNVFSGHERALAARFFLRQYRLDRTWTVRYTEYACLLLLPLFVALLIYYIYVFNLSIGSKATNLWLAVTSMAFTQDILLLYPCKVWINWVVINSALADGVRELCERLMARSRLILMRRGGVMRNAASLVQHFNPACRVARMYPQYPISRLLLSINDSDLPLLERSPLYASSYFYFSFGLLLLAFLPELLQDTALDIVTSSLVDFTLLALALLGTYVTPVLAVLLVLLAMGGFVAYEWLRRLREHWKHTSTQKGYNSTVFDELDLSGEDGGGEGEGEEGENGRGEAPASGGGRGGGGGDAGSAGGSIARWSKSAYWGAQKLLRGPARPLQGLTERSRNVDGSAKSSRQNFRGEVEAELVAAVEGDSDDSDSSEDDNGAVGVGAAPGEVIQLWQEDTGVVKPFSVGGVGFGAWAGNPTRGYGRGSSRGSSRGSNRDLEPAAGMETMSSSSPIASRRSFKPASPRKLPPQSSGGKTSQLGGWASSVGQGAAAVHQSDMPELPEQFPVPAGADIAGAAALAAAMRAAVLPSEKQSAKHTTSSGGGDSGGGGGSGGSTITSEKLPPLRPVQGPPVAHDSPFGAFFAGNADGDGGGGGGGGDTYGSPAHSSASQQRRWRQQRGGERDFSSLDISSSSAAGLPRVQGPPIHGDAMSRFFDVEGVEGGGGGSEDADDFDWEMRNPFEDAQDKHKAAAAVAGSEQPKEPRSPGLAVVQGPPLAFSTERVFGGPIAAGSGAEKGGAQAMMTEGMMEDLDNVSLLSGNSDISASSWIPPAAAAAATDDFSPVSKGSKGSKGAAVSKDGGAPPLRRLGSRSAGEMGKPLDSTAPSAQHQSADMLLSATIGPAASFASADSYPIDGDVHGADPGQGGRSVGGPDPDQGRGPGRRGSQLHRTAGPGDGAFPGGRSVLSDTASTSSSPQAQQPQQQQQRFGGRSQLVHGGDCEAMAPLRRSDSGDSEITFGSLPSLSRSSGQQQQQQQLSSFQRQQRPPDQQQRQQQLERMLLQRDYVSHVRGADEELDEEFSSSEKLQPLPSTLPQLHPGGLSSLRGRGRAGPSGGGGSGGSGAFALEAGQGFGAGTEGGVPAVPGSALLRHASHVSQRESRRRRHASQQRGALSAVTTPTAFAGGGPSVAAVGSSHHHQQQHQHLGPGRESARVMQQHGDVSLSGGNKGSPTRRILQPDDLPAPQWELEEHQQEQYQSMQRGVGPYSPSSNSSVGQQAAAEPGGSGGLGRLRGISAANDDDDDLSVQSGFSTGYPMYKY